MKPEKLYVKNFGGLDEISIELLQINVLIGPQASGKSICAKLCFFFKEIISDLAGDVSDGLTKENIIQESTDTFLKYFPASAWGKGSFGIRYSCGRLWISVKRKGRGSSAVAVSFSSYFDELINYGLDAAKLAEERGRLDHQKEMTAPRFAFDECYMAISRKLEEELTPAISNLNTFIPAGRSFFATIQRSLFSIIARDGTLDPFLVEFGRSYQRSMADLRDIRRHSPAKEAVEQYISRLIGGTYESIKDNDYIVMDDGRRVPVEISSSGQQEALPLVMTLASIAEGEGNRVCWSTVIIEEPEAHLFPNAQRDIIQFIALVSGLSSERNRSQYFITTHSPYILTALNNLMYGGKIGQENPEKKSQVSKLLNGVVVDSAHVHAYALGHKTARSIISLETGLVDAEELDAVSGELAREFEALADIEFEEQLS